MCRHDPTQVQSGKDATPSKQSLPIYFRFGRLKFGFHGVCASLALCVTTAALLSNSTDATTINLLVYSSVILNTVTAYQARQLLDQVPLKTEIVPGVVAPHREAFQRTMSMIHYGNLRILGCTLLTSCQWIYTAFLAWFIYKKFLPRAQFTNGNTFIFVVPMFVGTTVDLCQYTLVPNGGFMSIHHYLIIEVSALAIAFFFTLAFRGYFTVYQIYMVSALVVATLFGGGVYVILSSIAGRS